MRYGESEEGKNKRQAQSESQPRAALPAHQGVRFGSLCLFLACRYEGYLDLDLDLQGRLRMQAFDAPAMVV